MTIWYLARATGMVALIAFTLAVVLGAASSDSNLPRTTAPELVRRAIDQRVLRQLAHRSAALVGLGALGMHIVLILLDHYASVSFAGALIPFSAESATFAVGLGTLAVYVLVAVALSGLGRATMASSPGSARRWRSIHVLAYAGWTLTMGHSILNGTDTGALWATAIYVACGIAVPVAVWGRLGRSDRHTDDPLTAARRRAHTEPGASDAGVRS